MTRPRPQARTAAVDVARGVALAAMVVFHFAWDLNAFGLTGVSPAASPPWQLFGHLIACSFLFLSGFSLVLARERGSTVPMALRRIAGTAAAAAVLTAATVVIAPGQVIWFGILHCIALGDLLALPMVRAPAFLPLVAAMACIGVFIGARSTPVPGLWWLGLSDSIPDTLDARPLLPWLGAIFLGVAAGKAGWPAGLHRAGPHVPPPLAPLAVAGRHSLVVYLAHQPVLFALLFGVTAIIPVRSPASRFAAECVRTCKSRSDDSSCAARCACVEHQLSDGAIAAGVNPETFGDAVRLCRAAPITTGTHKPAAP